MSHSNNSESEWKSPNEKFTVWKNNGKCGKQSSQTKNNTWTRTPTMYVVSKRIKKRNVKKKARTSNDMKVRMKNYRTSAIRITCSIQASILRIMSFVAFFYAIFVFFLSPPLIVELFSFVTFLCKIFMFVYLFAFCIFRSVFMRILFYSLYTYIIFYIFSYVLHSFRLYAFASKFLLIDKCLFIFMSYPQNESSSSQMHAFICYTNEYIFFFFQNSFHIWFLVVGVYMFMYILYFFRFHDAFLFRMAILFHFFSLFCKFFFTFFLYGKLFHFVSECICTVWNEM